MSMDGTLAFGAVAAVTALVVLRLSWGKPARNAALNAAGSALALAATAAGAAHAGAWGIAVISLWAMGAAAVLLALSALQEPSKTRHSASNRRVGMLPGAVEPARIGRRVVTFFIVTIGGLIASVAFGTAVRWMAAAANAVEANANVAALFAAPMGWTMLTFFLLITPSRKRQFALISGTTATAIPAILTGSLM